MLKAIIHKDDILMNEDILWKIKNGQSEEAKELVKEQLHLSYSNSFPAFIDEMLDSYHVKRKAVADRTGLSTDYLYKMLRGDKPIKERDYVLAICIGIGMNLPQTQHALEITAMPLLDKRDIRSSIIISAIEEGASKYQLDSYLEKAELLPIKVSPDMETAPINLVSEKIIKDTHSYIEVSREINAERCGPAPFDYSYSGHITVADEDTGKKYYVLAAYNDVGSNYIILDEDNYLLSQNWAIAQHNKEEDFLSRHPNFNCESSKKLLEEYNSIINEPSPVTVLEQYDSLCDAAGSEFFDFFLALDRATDAKVIETMAMVDDTKYTDSGIQFATGPLNEKYASFIESYNSSHPEKAEYFQVIKYDDNSLIFSASHESYFMRMFLDQLYDAYFEHKTDPQYFIFSDSIENIPSEYSSYKIIFHNLYTTLCEQNGYSKVPSDDEVNLLLNKATPLFHNGQYQECIALINNALDIISVLEQQKNHVDYSSTKAVTYGKLAAIYLLLNNEELALESYKDVYSLKDDVLSSKMAGEDTKDALPVIGEAALVIAHNEQNAGNLDEAKKHTLDAISILESNCRYEHGWENLASAYTKYAFLIDADAPEEAIEYCEKARNVVKKHHLDRNICHLSLVFALYNNYAWVLWNRLGREEAIIYYGMAIDYLETFLDDPGEYQSEIISDLEHAGKALNSLYLATSKYKESARLVEQMKSKNICLS